MKKLLFGILPLVIAAGVNNISAASVAYVGAETSNTSSGNWGTSTASGYKSGFRSTSTDSKAYVLPGNPNAYGKDGYLFFATENETQFGIGSHLRGTVSSATSVTDPEGNTPVFNSPTSYISNITIGLPGDVGAQWATVRGGFGKMSDPTLGISSSVASIDYGIYDIFEQGDTTGAVYNALSFTLNSTVTFRVGFMVGPGDLEKPASMNLVGSNTASISMSGDNNYDRPDWYFFDVSGSVGETITLQLVQNGGSSQTTLSGLVFDSVAIPEPSSMALLGMVGAGMLMVKGLRRRRSLV